MIKGVLGTACRDPNSIPGIYVDCIEQVSQQYVDGLAPVIAGAAALVIALIGNVRVAICCYVGLICRCRPTAGARVCGKENLNRGGIGDRDLGTRNYVQIGPIVTALVRRLVPVQRNAGEIIAVCDGGDA